MKTLLKDYLFSLNILKAVFLFISTSVVLSIALSSPFNVHPDEFMHVNAFTYFEGRIWPPDLGSDDVYYSANGISRVYSGEIIYPVYGNLSYIIQKTFHIGSSYLIYRILNVLLYFITLGLLLFSKPGIFKFHYPGFIFGSIPQISYIYAYANSDACPMSVGIFLFMLAARKYPSPILKWNLKDIILLGVGTGLIFSSKRNYYLTLFMPFFLIFYAYIKESKAMNFSISEIIRIFSAFLIPVILIASPLKIFYPLSQQDYHKKRLMMIEERSVDGYKPSNPWNSGKQLSKKGYTYRKMLAERTWFTTSIKSFWGYFGGMNIPNPSWIYRLILSFWLILILITVKDFFTPDGASHTIFQLCLIFSCAVIGLNIFFSLSYSLNIDYQPQGRYLFPSFIPASLWLTGNTFQKGKTACLRNFILSSGWLICLYSLIAICLMSLKA